MIITPPSRLLEPVPRPHKDVRPDFRTRRQRLWVPRRRPDLLNSNGERLLNRDGTWTLQGDGSASVDDNLSDYNNCCCCICSGDQLQNYGKTFLVTFSGISVPLGDCLAYGGSGGFSFATANVNMTYCVHLTPSSVFLGECEYDLTDTSCTNGAGYENCDPYSALVCGQTIVILTIPDPGGTKIEVQLGSPNVVFRNTTFRVLPCGGSVVIPNEFAIFDRTTSGTWNFGGTCTVSDTSC